MIKVFISQPMRDKTNEEIKEERQKAIKAAQKLFCDEDVEVLDSFFENAPHEAKPLWFLGESLKLLSTADVVVFTPGWSNYRGCKIEHICAMEYGIDSIEL